MIKIDFKCFMRQHYWFGFFYWNNCIDHKHYNSNCKDCNAGRWKYISNKKTLQTAVKDSSTEFMAVAFKYSNLFSNNIFRMPMNNVVWLKGDGV